MPHGDQPRMGEATTLTLTPLSQATPRSFVPAAALSSGDAREEENAGWLVELAELGDHLAAPLQEGNTAAEELAPSLEGDGDWAVEDFEVPVGSTPPTHYREPHPNRLGQALSTPPQEPACLEEDSPYSALNLTPTLVHDELSLVRSALADLMTPRTPASAMDITPKSCRGGASVAADKVACGPRSCWSSPKSSRSWGSSRSSSRELC